MLLGVERNLESMLLSKDLALKDANASKIRGEKDRSKQNAFVAEMKSKFARQNEVIKSQLFPNDQTHRDSSNSSNHVGRKERDDENNPLGTSGTNTSCKKNREVIEYLHQQKRLSDGDYKTAKEMIKQSAKLSNKQFSILVQQYCSLRKMDGFKERMKPAVDVNNFNATKMEMYVAKEEIRCKNVMQNLRTQVKWKLYLIVLSDSME